MSLNEKKLIPAKGLVDPPNHMTVTGVKHASMDCAGDDLNSPQSKRENNSSTEGFVQASVWLVTQRLRDALRDDTN